MNEKEILREASHRSLNREFWTWVTTATFELFYIMLGTIYTKQRILNLDEHCNFGTFLHNACYDKHYNIHHY